MVCSRLRWWMASRWKSSFLSSMLPYVTLYCPPKSQRYTFSSQGLNSAVAFVVLLATWVRSSVKLDTLITRWQGDSWALYGTWDNTVRHNTSQYYPNTIWSVGQCWPPCEGLILGTKFRHRCGGCRCHSQGFDCPETEAFSYKPPSCNWGAIPLWKKAILFEDLLSVFDLLHFCGTCPAHPHPKSASRLDCTSVNL